MSFVSFEFVIFALIVLPLYFILSPRFRGILLLLSSLYFYYFGNGAFILILLMTALVDFYLARAISRDERQTRKRLYLIGSMSLNLGILFFYKYFNFFAQSFGRMVSIVDQAYQAPRLDLILPIGISFYTFQEMSYVIDVYRGNLTPAKNFGVFTTYVAFFPQLVAGPIERGTNLLPQFYERFKFDADRVTRGLRLILWGFFKKVVIADRLATYVNAVYAHPTAYSGLPLLIATFFFAFQIYCDFSGYTDIAIGLAEVMGFSLMNNFRQPYFSRSIREFWRRWHISLSTWFRDYLYIPLGGNRVTFSRMLFNLLVVFVVSGLWHGASWTFVIWGALHGLYIMVETILARWRAPNTTTHPVRAALSIGITFVLVLVAWVFFRAQTFSDAWYVVTHMFNLGHISLSAVVQPFPANDSIVPILEHVNFANLSSHTLVLLYAFGLIVLLLLIDFIDAREGLNAFLNRLPTLVRWLYYYVLIFTILLMGAWGSQQFIYFKF